MSKDSTLNTKHFSHVLLVVISLVYSLNLSGQQSIHLGLNVSQYNFSLNDPSLVFDNDLQRGIINISYKYNGLVSGFSVGVSRPNEEYSNWDAGLNLGVVLFSKQFIQFPLQGYIGYLVQNAGDNVLKGLYVSGIAECRIHFSRDFYLKGGINYGVNYVTNFNDIETNISDSTQTKVKGIHLGIGIVIKSEL